MDQNYYVQQMYRQSMIQRISSLLAIVLLVGVLLLWVHSRFRKRRRRIAALLAGFLLLGSMGVQQAEAAPGPGLTVTAGQKEGEENRYLPDVCIRAILETTGERLVVERMFGSSMELVELSAGEDEAAGEQLQRAGIHWMTVLSEETGENGGPELELQFREDGVYHIKRVSVKALPSDQVSETQDAGKERVTEEEVLSIIIGKTSSEKEKQEEIKEDPAAADQGERPADKPAEEEVKPAEVTRPETDKDHSDREEKEEKEESTAPLVVDRTAPSISITGVENAAVYGRPVTPVIHIEDSGLSFSSVKYALKGARTGSLNLQTLADVKKNSHGLDIRMDGFRSAADDVYTLSVRAADQAGNISREEVVFSMDQEGSAFILSDATKDLVEKYYTDQPEDVVLSEVNTGGVFYELALSRDGTPQALEEDRDYSVEVRGGDGDWMIYTYRIFADTFREDGVYHLDITSRDQADNVNNNQIRDARIDFVVDKSGAGAVDGKKDRSRGENKKKAADSSSGQEAEAERTDMQPEHAVPEYSATEKEENTEHAEEKNPAALAFLLAGGLVTVAAGLYLLMKKERWLQ